MGIDLSQYFKIKIAALVRVRPLEFDMYIYLPLNDKVICYRKSGVTVEESLKLRLADHGITECYILRSEREKYEAFLEEPILNDGRIFEQWLSQDSQQEATGEINAAESLKEAIESVPSDDNQLAALLGEPRPRHSISVASFSLLFARKVGFTDPVSLQDLAIGALVFDVGLTQIPLGIISVPHQSRTSKLKMHYSKRIKKGQKLLAELNIGLPNRVRAMLTDKKNELGQIIILGSLVDLICRGYFDGAEHTMGQAVNMVAQIEPSDSLLSSINGRFIEAIQSLVSSHTAAPIA